jgi:hypothetical protein
MTVVPHNYNVFAMSNSTKPLLNLLFSRTRSQTSYFVHHRCVRPNSGVGLTNGRTNKISDPKPNSSDNDLLSSSDAFSTPSSGHSRDFSVRLNVIRGAYSSLEFVFVTCVTARLINERQPSDRCVEFIASVYEQWTFEIVIHNKRACVHQPDVIMTVFKLHAMGICQNPEGR